jgi:hypothetical protein
MTSVFRRVDEVEDVDVMDAEEEEEVLEKLLVDVVGEIVVCAELLEELELEVVEASVVRAVDVEVTDEDVCKAVEVLEVESKA